MLASAPVVAVAAFLFERYIDAPSVALSSKIANALLNSEQSYEWRKLAQKYSPVRYAQRLRKRLTRAMPAEAVSIDDESLQI